MNSDNLSSIQLDALKETLNISIGNSASKLSDYLQKEITLTTPTANIVEIKDVFSLIGHPDEEVFAIFSHFIGEIEGYVLYIVKQNFYDKLSLFAQSGIDKTKLLTDINSIISSSFIEALAEFTGLNLNIDCTEDIYDTLSVIVEQGILEYSQFSDKIFFLKNSFVFEGNALECHSIFFPNPSQFDIFFRRFGI